MEKKLLTFTTDAKDYDFMVADISVENSGVYFLLETYLNGDFKENITFRYLKYADFSEEEYAAIIKQAGEYMHFLDITIERSSNTETRANKIGVCSERPEAIVVDNGKFAGIHVINEAERENHLATGKYIKASGIVFADGSHVGLVDKYFEASPGQIECTEQHKLMPVDQWRK